MKEIAKTSGRAVYRGGSLTLISLVLWLVSDFRSEMRREISDLNAHRCNCRDVGVRVPMPDATGGVPDLHAEDRRTVSHKGAHNPYERNP
jgi:hypothetical protein